MAKMSPIHCPIGVAQNMPEPTTLPPSPALRFSPLGRSAAAFGLFLGMTTFCLAPSWAFSLWLGSFLIGFLMVLSGTAMLYDMDVRAYLARNPDLPPDARGWPLDYDRLRWPYKLRYAARYFWSAIITGLGVPVVLVLSVLVEWRVCDANLLERVIRKVEAK